MLVVGESLSGLPEKFKQLLPEQYVLVLRIMNIKYVSELLANLQKLLSKSDPHALSSGVWGSIDAKELLCLQTI